MQVLFNRDESWVTIASDAQHKRLVTLINKAYDISKDKVKPEIMAKYQKKKKAQTSIPPHEHKPEICKIYDCNFLENTIKDLLQSGASFNEDLILRFSGYLNRMLLSMTFNRNTPAYMRSKYNMYLHSLDSQAANELSFYERQEIDMIIKEGKEMVLLNAVLDQEKLKVPKQLDFK